MSRHRNWTQGLFWFVAVFLALLVSLAILWPLVRSGVAPPLRAEHDVEVYGAQIRELQGDLERGVLPPDEAANAKAEIGRRLLKAAAETRRSRPENPNGPKRLVTFAGVVSAVLLIAGSIGFYAMLGRPGEPDMPMEARLAVDPAKADIPTLVAQAETRLRNDPDDGRGWDMLLPIYLRMGRAKEAVTAADNAIRLLGSTSEREAMRGEAQTRAASGEVTEAAKTSFRTALRLDPSNASARFFLALGSSQAGDIAAAVAAWKAVLDLGPADAPWMEASRMAYDDARRELEASLPAQSSPGPSSEQMAAAGEMSAQDRSAMISAMMSQLAERLKSAPNDLDGWKRLMRSYTVLGEQAQAREIYLRARALFAEGSSERVSIDDFAATLGLAGTGTTP